MNDTMNDSNFRKFRQALYGCFERAGDALMNLNDALLSGASTGRFVELSQSPFFERRWSSLYEATKDGCVNRNSLLVHLISAMPVRGPAGRCVVAIDSSKAERPQSVTARDRTLVHKDNLPECRAPVTPGWQFSTVAVAPATASSWCYILDNERIASDKTPTQVAAEQLRKIVPVIRQAHGVRPLVVADSGYGTAPFLKQTRGIECDKLVRMKGFRNLYRAPGPPDPHKRGPHFKDGPIFKCHDPGTQGEPDASSSGMDEKGRVVKVDCWNNLHFKECRESSISLLRITREGAAQTKRDPRQSWFFWEGDTPAPLSDAHLNYKFRFCIEHSYRFEKQDLNWTQPRLRTPEQFQLWTLMVSVVQDQLFLARELVERQRLPWEDPNRPITPEQVRRGMGPLLAKLGTPARPPKPRGMNAKGRAKGAVVRLATRYAVIKKDSKPRKKAATKPTAGATRQPKARTQEARTQERKGVARAA